ncbi:MAG: hypothetical protein AB7F41_07000 [Methylocystis sp.]|uniref:hypothetical protein n=1 Tax=Methylocystis sp. TaxID=1911079 RepID=UPI003D133461
MRALLPALISALCVISVSTAAPAAASQDADEAELLKHYEKVDVWHFPVDYTVAYNDRDVVVTREMVAQPAPAGKLCYIRFDLLRGEGDYAYGFKPPRLGEARPDAWGVFVHKRGTVLNQARSALKMNVVYFYVDGPKDDAHAKPDICAQMQAAQTPQAGHGYTADEWSDLIVRARLIHGWPAPAH